MNGEMRHELPEAVRHRRDPGCPPDELSWPPPQTPSSGGASKSSPPKSGGAGGRRAAAAGGVRAKHMNLPLDVHKSQGLPPQYHNGVVPRRACAAELAELVGAPGRGNYNAPPQRPSPPLSSSLKPVPKTP